MNCTHYINYLNKNLWNILCTTYHVKKSLWYSTREDETRHEKKLSQIVVLYLEFLTDLVVSQFDILSQAVKSEVTALWVCPNMILTLELKVKLSALTLGSVFVNDIAELFCGQTFKHKFSPSLSLLEINYFWFFMKKTSHSERTIVPYTSYLPLLFTIRIFFKEN